MFVNRRYLQKGVFRDVAVHTNEKFTRFDVDPRDAVRMAASPTLGSCLR
jgi:hypothetical protein